MEFDRLLSLVKETELRPSFPRYELFILIAVVVVCVPLPADLCCAAILTIISLRMPGTKADRGGSGPVSAPLLRKQLTRNLIARFIRTAIHTILTVLLFRYSYEIIAQLVVSSKDLQEDVIHGGDAIVRLQEAFILPVIMCGFSAAVWWLSMIRFFLKKRELDTMGLQYPSE